MTHTSQAKALPLSLHDQRPLRGSSGGFSLLELSIVIIIISLLVGGVLAGNALLKNSELRSVYVSANEYISAIDQFNEKYQGLPGDLYNATTIWGEQHATPATCQTTASSSKLTCNGNGDGRVGDDAATYYENFRAWQHLQNAGMAPGAYSGISNGAANTNISLIGTNVPAGGIAGTGFSFFYLNIGAANVFSNTGLMLYFGKQTTGGMTTTAAISAKSAWTIDMKVDDGEPAFGKVITSDTGLLANCATTAVASTADYNLAGTTAEACHLMFATGVQ